MFLCLLFAEDAGLMVLCHLLVLGAVAKVLSKACFHCSSILANAFVVCVFRVQFASLFNFGLHKV